MIAFFYPLFLIGIFIIIPLLLTVINIRNLISRKHFIKSSAAKCTLILGPLYTSILFKLLSMPEWDNPIVLGDGSVGLHTPLAYKFLPTFLTFAILGIIGCWNLVKVNKKFSPLLTVLFGASVITANIFHITAVIQLYPVFSTDNIWQYIMFTLYPLNFLLISISAFLQLHSCFSENIEAMQPNNRFTVILYQILRHSYGLSLISLIAVLPFISVCILLLTLFGQQPDSAVKVFTETSDWLFSTKISPEPIYYEGHYLCTVAAGGHRKLVKPIRYGMRKGKKIIINRQLCVANAFEDLVQKHTPRLHHSIRYIYDKYGYPISRHIRTPLSADIVYILMKPLEWFFLMILYLFDIYPENRIAVQYVPKKDDVKPFQE